MNISNPAEESSLAESTGRVTSGDVEIFYRRFGVKSNLSPIIIAHGLSYFSFDWIDIARSLAHDREVVAFDLRGFGESTWSASLSYEPADMAGDIISLLDELAWPEAILVGHSMGGRVSLIAAGSHPQRAKALVCVDFAPDVSPAGRRKVAERVGNQPDFFESVEAAMAYHGQQDSLNDHALRERWEAFLRETLGGWQLKRDLHFRDTFRRSLISNKPPAPAEPLWATVRNLEIPSLFIRGESSDMFAEEVIEKLHQQNQRVQAVEIEGGHALMHDNPSGLTRAIKAFVGSLD